MSESGGNAYPDLFGTGIHSPIIERAEGSTFIDLDGNQFVDATGAFACSTFGLDGRPLVEAMCDQLMRLPHVPDLPTLPRVELAEKLGAIAFPKSRKARVQFDVGGSGSVDLAYKLAHYYSRVTWPESEHKAIAFSGAYHGRTSTTSRLTGSAHAQEYMPGANMSVIRMPFPYAYRSELKLDEEEYGEVVAKFIRRQLEDDAWGIRNPRTGNSQATIMFWEPIQAHIGMIFPPVNFMRLLREICDDFGILLVDDEVAMGIGHTGQWFACQWYGVEPDIIVTSKALTGGLYPLGAVIARDDVWRAWGSASDKHMGSYHGNPVGCAVALKNLELMEEHDALAHVRELGKYVEERLAALSKRHALVGEARNVGLAIGIELVADRVSKVPATAECEALVRECYEDGLLILRLGYYGNRLNLTPVLDSSRAEIDFIFDTLDRNLGIVETRV